LVALIDTAAIQKAELIVFSELSIANYEPKLAAENKKNKRYVLPFVTAVF
jgi:predicted amidohydrolase